MLGEVLGSELCSWSSMCKAWGVTERARLSWCHHGCFIRKAVSAPFQRAKEHAGGWLEHGGNNQSSPAATLSLRSPEAPGSVQNRIIESFWFEKTFKIIDSS